MIKAHQAGVEHFRELIEHGKVDDGPYTFDGADKEALLGPKGTHVRMLALAHLGEDDELQEGEAKRYKYPCAKDGKVFTRALRSCRDRAGENGHAEVRDAGEALLGMIADGGGAEGAAPADAGGRSLSSTDAGEPEKRFVRGLEFRSAPDGSDSPGTIVGYAAVFDRLSEDLGGFRELIKPRAFRDVLKQDIRALANHSPMHLLGRAKSGTLRIRETPTGLADEIDLPDTDVGRSTAVSIRRGDMDGQSFSFRVKPEDVEWDWDTTPPTRIIHRFSNVYDVGPVTDAAYPDTSVSMRTLRAAREARCRRTNPPAPEPQDRSIPLALAKARQATAEATLSPPTPRAS